MSRTNKPRPYHWSGHNRRCGYSYVSKHLTWAKKNGNQRVRQEVRQRMRTIPLDDSFDEVRIPNRKGDIFDRRYYT
jgi:uncharacterized Fe-S cluster-containing radical SAM superfamily protein